MMLFNLQLNHIIQSVLGRLSIERCGKDEQEKKSDTKINKVTTLHLHNWQICLMRIALNSAWIIYEPTFIRLNVGFISTYFIYISTFLFSFSFFLTSLQLSQSKSHKKECRSWVSYLGRRQKPISCLFPTFLVLSVFPSLARFHIHIHSLSLSVSISAVIPTAIFFFFVDKIRAFIQSLCFES